MNTDLLRHELQGDFDVDGVTDLKEYVADTNPFDAGNRLRIVDYDVSFFGLTSVNTITWTSRQTRQYRLEYRNTLGTDLWTDVGISFSPDDSTVTTRTLNFIGASFAERYFRVRPLRPLEP